MQNDAFNKQEAQDMNHTTLEAARANLESQRLAGLAELLQTNPDAAADILAHSAQEQWAVMLPDVSDEGDDKQEGKLLERAEQALAEAAQPEAASLGELRARAQLTIDEVAEGVGLNIETIDFMEEDIPIIDTPRSLLRTIGDLFGYSAVQIDRVLRAQGTFGSADAAYKLRHGVAAAHRVIKDSPYPRSFAEVLEETGATEEQKRHWLTTSEIDEDENGEMTDLERDLFA